MTDPAPLIDAFTTRPNRFHLLRKGIVRTGWSRGGLKLLETGCSIGDAAAMMASEGFLITGVDLSEEFIRRAGEKHGDKNGLDFICADAADLPFPAGSFDGLYCEAAFSPIRRKKEVLREYYRILRDDAKVLVNDFVIRKEASDSIRSEVIHIPCFAGVQTRECYEELFKSAGFELLEYHDEFGELIGLTAWLCRFYCVTPDEIGGYLSSFFHSGASDGATCGSDAGDHQGAFFRKTELSCCQMIFQKKG